MKTSKPLRELVPEILTYINEKYEGYIIYNKKLLDMFEGQSKKYIEDRLRKELSPKSFERSRNRIPPINILKQIVDKQTNIYAEPASRSLKKENDTDSEILSNAEDEADIDNQLSYLSQMLVLHQYVACEWYRVDDKKKLRVLNATEFIPFSDSKENPNEMTVFIKFMGKKQKIVLKEVDEYGKKLDNPIEVVQDVEFFRLYSENEYLEVDADGAITDYDEHNRGYFTQLYVKQGQKLLPTPQDDMYEMSTLLPTLMTDINYYIQFTCHSILFGKDIEIDGELEFAPDVYWNVRSVDKGPEQNVNSEIGTIQPNSDTGKIWDSIFNQFSMFLESKGLKTSGVGKVDGQNASSGIAKVIDESDATRVRKKLKTLLSQVESDVWQLYMKRLGEWVDGNYIKSPKFSKDNSVMVEFAEEKPLYDFNQQLDEEKKLKDLGLTTKKLSLVRLFPHMSDTEIDEMIIKIEEEKEENEIIPENTDETIVKEEEEDNGSK